MSWDEYARFTDRARKIMTRAENHAEQSGHGCIDIDHLLLGLLEEGNGVATRLLTNLNVDLKAIKADVEKRLRQHPKKFYLGRPPLSPRCQYSLDLAKEEAARLKHDFLGSEHILLGIINEA